MGKVTDVAHHILRREEDEELVVYQFNLETKTVILIFILDLMENHRLGLQNLWLNSDL